MVLDVLSCLYCFHLSSILIVFELRKKSICWCRNTHTHNKFYVSPPLRPEVSSCLLPLNIVYINIQNVLSNFNFANISRVLWERRSFLGWAGCALFMMQYAMLITLHIPKWKNCFFKKKGRNTIEYTECIFLRYI